MINDIREYYHNLTKLQKKKFELFLENKYLHSQTQDYDTIYMIILYLRLYTKIQSGRKFDNTRWQQITNLMKDDLFNAEYLCNDNYQELQLIFEPKEFYQYNITTAPYLLDLFQRVLK